MWWDGNTAMVSMLETGSTNMKCLTHPPQLYACQLLKMRQHRMHTASLLAVSDMHISVGFASFPGFGAYRVREFGRACFKVVHLGTVQRHYRCCSMLLYWRTSCSCWTSASEVEDERYQEALVTQIAYPICNALQQDHRVKQFSPNLFYQLMLCNSHRGPFFLWHHSISFLISCHFNASHS